MIAQTIAAVFSCPAQCPQCPSSDITMNDSSTMPPMRWVSGKAAADAAPAVGEIDGWVRVGWALIKAPRYPSRSNGVSKWSVVLELIIYAAKRACGARFCLFDLIKTIGFLFFFCRTPNAE